jgi:hypothetical protein
MVASGVESFHDINTVTLFNDKHGGSIIPGTASFPASGRNGGNAIQSVGGARWQFVYDSVATAYFGGAFNFSAAIANNSEFLDVRDATVTHLTYTVNADGSIDIKRGGSGGTLLASSAAGVLVSGAYDYYEFKHLIANAGGTAEVLKNGVSVVSFSGDTQNAGTAASTNVSLYTVTSGNGHWCDIYYGDTGAYWGDIRVECIHPTGAGNSAVLTRGGADSGANWSQVEEVVPNDDTDYVTSGTPGDKDTYAYANLTSTGGTVRAVQINERARKDDAGARSIVSVARLSGTETDGAVHTLSTSYGSFRSVRTTKPGGGAWAIADVNNAEFGVKINA